MNTLDTTKNIAYMHICQVISSADYSIIYLCYHNYIHVLDPILQVIVTYYVL